MIRHTTWPFHRQAVAGTVTDMKSWMIGLLAIAACGYPPLQDLGDGGGSGGSGTPDAQACYGTFVRVCFTVVPTTSVMLGANTDISTDDTATCNQNNDQASRYCVYAGAGFSLTGNNVIRAHGSKPLVLVSTTTMTLSGDIDVSSKHDGSPPGAGAATAASCTAPNIVEAAGTSGGYGGSFGGRGGDGEQVLATGELKGSPAPATSFPSLLRGGCPGGAGAMGVGAAGTGLGGAGGTGGGAVALIATSITVDGKINASGAGGHGGPTSSKSGGGGGGSGGMIVLDSSTPILTTIRMKIFANGGGGGQGGEAGLTGGADGGESMAPTLPGAGGSKSGTNAGTGGNGSFGSNPAAGPTPDDASNGGGGGAGGGGGGFVRAPGVSGTNVAPPPINS